MAAIVASTLVVGNFWAAGVATYISEISEFLAGSCRPLVLKFREGAPVKKNSTTRRQFIAGSAAAAATTACATGQTARPIVKAGKRADLGPDDTIRMGIIGVGGMGGGHLGSTINQNNNGEDKVHVVALSDVCKPRLDNRLNQARNDQKGVQVDGYRDYKELLARDDIHCVLIASPEHWHAQQAVDAIEAGKDVYVEKPLCLDLDEAFELQELAQAKGRVLMVGHLLQYHACIEKKC